ncbi:hypothetical protein GIY62_06190 [Burkholderia plantarii]|uniref:hypothetical protein n=1 Tax=Burkholderia plantarii TaxID=41899 RepID=UPI00272BBAB6|nr:hypothetical protein [Burkholderia plantarii]WLE60247.1 hypothetical protein GIY62_06190 [Burkholderia plantarii]
MKHADLLREKTHKEPGLDVGRRVYYTLTDDQTGDASAPIDPTLHRTIKLLSLLVEKLTAESRLTETELDQMLLQLLG